MSFNKTKAMKNAERYLTQGKITAAINEYKQVVENDPKDINSRNMLGDLYMKADESQAAVNCYQEVADHYSSQGFAKKAIAIYNKIYRIDSSSIEVASKLAELYQTRGSNAEARNLYREIAKRYEEKGHKIEALSIWEKIAQIAPNDKEIYLKIAEAYWQSDRREESAKAYIEAGNRLADLDQHEAAVTAFSRSLEVFPDDEAALKGFVKSQIVLGFAEDGAVAVEKALESNPYHKELNYLLMDCYFEVGSIDKAEALIIKLVEREPADYPKLLELVKIYFENDDIDSAVRILAMTSEHLLVGGESDDLLELLNEVLARDPEHLAALRLLARYHGWQKDEHELKQTLERLAEAAYLSGAIDDERYALSQYVLLMPHDVERSDRLKEINDEYGYEGNEEEQPLFSTSADVPTFESFATLNNDEDSTSETDFEVLSANDVVEEHSSDVEEIDSEDAIPIEEDEQESLDEPVPVSAFDENEEAAADYSDNIEDSKVGDLSPADEVRVDEEIDSIKFYIEQGYTGLAEKSLGELENEFGSRPEIVELRQQLPNDNDETTDVAVTGDEPEIGLADTAESEVEEVAESDITEEVDEFQDNVSEDAVVDESEDVETEQNEFSGDASEESEPGLSESDEEESEESPEADIVESEDFEDSEENSDAHSEEMEDVNHTKSFDNFKDELGLDENEAGEVEKDDYEEHYHHAVVYQEMGMLEDAIREFQDAVACIDANDGTRRFLNCCTLIGHCFNEKEMPNLALSWFEKSLETEDLSEKETLGIYYEIANAYEANDEIQKAVNQFEKIYSLDVDYRDVSERLDKLRENEAIPV